MESTSSVVPAAGQVHNIYGRLMSVINKNENSRKKSEAEDIREMRFVLRKFIFNIIGLADSGSDDKEAYVKAAQDAAASHASSSTSKSVGTKTAEMLCSILKDSAWGVVEGVELEQQDTNVTLKGMRDGVKATIDSLSASLQEDGSELREYGTDIPSSSIPETFNKSKGKASTAATTPSQTPGRPGNFGHSLARKWTDEERLEVLCAYRDFPMTEYTFEKIVEEFKRGDAASRARRGLPALRTEDERTSEAIRQEHRKLEKDGKTVESIEAALAAQAGTDAEG